MIQTLEDMNKAIEALEVMNKIHVEMVKRLFKEKRETPETETIFCAWSEQENGPWLSACGEDFNLEDGTPVENKMKFCCWCGKPLKEKLFVEED